MQHPAVFATVFNFAITKVKFHRDNAFEEFVSIACLRLKEKTIAG